jgi:cobalt-zinc-cadmium efflux system membrane fusion protein
MSTWHTVLTLSASVGLLVGCTQESKIPEVPAQAAATSQGPTQITLSAAQEQQLGIALSQASLRRFPLLVQATGQVKAVADLIAHISTPVTGRVSDVEIQLGRQVAKGQVLAKIKSDDIGQIQADLLQAILQADGEIRSARVQLDFSKAAYEREQQLIRERIASRADLEAARTQYQKDLSNYQFLQARRQATVRIAQERLSLYGVTPGVAQTVVRNRRIDPYIAITAPKSGVLIARNINNGELAEPRQELFTTADLSRVWLVANIYEKDIEKIRLGQAVQITLDSLPGKVYPGRLTYIADTLDPTTRTLSIRADVSNPALTLKPDMFARMQVRIRDTQVLAVPSSALQRSGDFTFVYVPLGKRVYQERRVEVGLDGGTHVQIIRGLRPGEAVVTHGTLALKGEALKLSGADAGS